MKGFLKVLFLVILLVLATPFAMIGTAMIKDSTVPLYLHNFNSEEFIVEDEMEAKIKYVMMSNVLGNKSIELDEEFIGKILYTSTEGFKQTEMKLTDDTVMKIEQIWFVFDDNKFTMYGLIAAGETKTTFTVKLKFEDHEGYTKIYFDTIKIGKLPVPKSLIKYGLTRLEEDGADLETINPLGQFDLEELYITIEDSYINDEIRKAVKSDLINFHSITLDNHKIKLQYDFTTTTEGETLKLALDDINNLVTNSAKRSDINSKLINLQNSGTIDAQTKTSIDNVLDLLEQKSTTSDFNLTDEDMELIQEFTDNLSNLSSDQATEVSQVFIDNLDNKDEIIAKLEEMGASTDLSDLFNQFLGTK